MKIALLTPFYPYRGGIAQFSLSLFRELRRENKVQVFSFSRLYPDFLFPGKSQFVEDETVVDALSKRILDSINPLTYEKTARRIAEFEPDVLIVAYWMSFFAPAYAHIAWRLRKKTKIIALIHNAIPHEPKFFDRPLARSFFRQCSECAVLSEAVKNDVLSIYPKANCRLIFHPLYDHFGEKIEKETAQQKLNLNRNKKTLLFFGLIRDYKGLDLLIDAMKYLDETYQLVIAGECYGDFEKYQQQIDESPAKERIRIFNHYISDAETPVFFSAADLLVLPYRSATQSGVIPVACHFETPIVVTDVGGLRETVENPGIGLVCKPDAQSISDKIKEFFIIDQNVFNDNFQKVKEALSWQRFVEKLF
jgi:glycosyltransferase involved in cell wall biosynthesis